MNFPMRLFRRPPKIRPLPPEEQWIWYAEFDRKVRISLKTADEKLANKSYERLTKAWLTRNLAILEGRPPTKRLEDFAEEYLEWSFQTKRPFTTQTDSQALRRALRYFGPATPLGAITRRQVDLWLAAMGQEVKRVSANTWLRHFKAAMSKAVDWKYLKANPCQGVKQLAIDEPLPRYLAQEEFARILAAEPDPAFRCLWEIYLRTGCRRAEILQLTGQNIDYQGMTITVRRTKNRRVKRVPMTPEIAALFRSIPVQVGRLFPWTLDYVTHHFHKTARAAGVQCRLHDLRHTYCSWMIQAGVPLRVVQVNAGHRSSKTTERYAWASETQQAEAQGKIKIGDEY
jgi:integrase